MNTSLHIPDNLVDRLNRYLVENPNVKSKNALIISAIEQFLDSQDSSWGTEVLSWGGEEIESLDLDRNCPWREEIL